MYYAETFKLIKFFIRGISNAKINIPRREHRGTVLNVSHCMFYKVVAVGFNTLRYDASVGVLNPPHE